MLKQILILVFITVTASTKPQQKQKQKGAINQLLDVLRYPSARMTVASGIAACMATGAFKLMETANQYNRLKDETDANTTRIKQYMFGIRKATQIFDAIASNAEHHEAAEPSFDFPFIEKASIMTGSDVDEEIEKLFLQLTSTLFPMHPQFLKTESEEKTLEKYLKMLKDEYTNNTRERLSRMNVANQQDHPMQLYPSIANSLGFIRTLNVKQETKQLFEHLITASVSIFGTFVNQNFEQPPEINILGKTDPNEIPLMAALRIAMIHIKCWAYKTIKETSNTPEGSTTSNTPFQTKFQLIASGMSKILSNVIEINEMALRVKRESSPYFRRLHSLVAILAATAAEKEIMEIAMQNIHADDFVGALSITTLMHYISWARIWMEHDLKQHRPIPIGSTHRYKSFRSAHRNYCEVNLSTVGEDAENDLSGNNTGRLDRRCPYLNRSVSIPESLDTVGGLEQIIKKEPDTSNIVPSPD